MARESTARAEGRVRDAEEAVQESERRAMEADLAIERCRQRATQEDSRVAERVREVRDCQAQVDWCRENLAKLVEPNQENPIHFSQHVLKECQNKLEETFTRYLNGDCEITTTARDLVASDLSEQLHLVLNSDFLREAVALHDQIYATLKNTAGLWKDVCKDIKDLGELCQSILVSDNERAPQRVFQRVQLLVIQPSLDIIQQHANEWMNVKTQLDKLAQQFGHPPLDL